MTPAPRPQLRLARPSRDLGASIAFYTRGLDLVVLASFEDHAGIDGVILGRPEWPYHLEFTRRRRAPLIPMQTDEDLMVFYLPDPAAWTSAIDRLRAFGAREVLNANPYWHRRGVTFEDPDGNRVVLQNAAWPERGDEG